MDDGISAGMLLVRGYAPGSSSSPSSSVFPTKGRSSAARQTPTPQGQGVFGSKADADRICDELVKYRSLKAGEPELHLIKAQIFNWLEGRNSQGHHGDSVYLPLRLQNRLYIIEDDFPDYRIHDMEKQKQLLQSANRVDAIQGLAASILEATKGDTDKTVGQWQINVSRELAKFKDPDYSLPAGVSDRMVRFLAHSAGIGLWDRLAAERDVRIPELLLGYYLSEEPLTDLGQRIGGFSAARASQLIAAGVDFLLEQLPETWSRWRPDGGLETIHKIKEYPKDLLRRGRAGRGGEASRQSALRRWNDADEETRSQWLDRIDQGTHSPEAREKVSKTVRAQWAKRKKDEGNATETRV